MALRADPSLGETLDEGGGRYAEVQDPVDERDPAERHGLGDVPGKPVQEEAEAGVRMIEPLPEQAEDQIVRDEVARLHVTLGLPTEIGVSRDRGPEEITGGEMRDPELFREARGLGPFARPGRPEEDDAPHRPADPCR